MRHPTFGQTGRSPVNLTPMIDVVFLLIVFFSATSTMVRTEYSHSVELPEATEGKDREDSAQVKRITVNVLPSTDAFVGGERVGPRRLRAILVAELKSTPAENIEIQFRTDQSTPYRAVEPLLLTCAKSGVWRVGFAVRDFGSEGDR